MFKASCTLQYLYLYVYFRRIAEAFESKHVALDSVFSMFIFVFSHFGRRKVHFGLGTKSIQVTRFTVFYYLQYRQRGFFDFLGGVLSLKIVFAPRFVAKKITLLDHGQAIVKSCPLLQPIRLQEIKKYHQKISYNIISKVFRNERSCLKVHTSDHE